MRMFLAGNGIIPTYITPILLGGDFSYLDNEIRNYRPYILESFYYVDEDTERLLPYLGDFLLDSGAFTFMSNSGSHVDWEDYLERYAAFINRHKVEKFFELDIDSVVGYKKVLEYRKRLEALTGRPCIPVWHKSRGIEEFKKMCAEYGYVAVGASGQNDSKWSREKPEALSYLIKVAHQNKARIHGLGFTSLKLLPQLHFDSVDSTAWTTGNRFGYIYRFNGETMTKVNTPPGKRLKDSRTVALINYVEWIKFQMYAEKCL